MTVCFATHNQGKVREVQQLLPSTIEVVGLDDIGCEQELPETQKTLEGNSHQKAEYVFRNYRVNCFADDTGLEVFALDGAPGVYSARYAGEHKSSEDNIDLLLQRLREEDSRKERSNREAQFRTVITLIMGGKTRQFEGIVKGYITEERRGSDGFGYDPVFVPKGSTQTFAEMSLEEKNKISHRAIAVNKLVQYLKTHIS